MMFSAPERLAGVQAGEKQTQNQKATQMERDISPKIDDGIKK